MLTEGRLHTACTWPSWCRCWVHPGGLASGGRTPPPARDGAAAGDARPGRRRRGRLAGPGAPPGRSSRRGAREVRPGGGGCRLLAEGPGRGAGGWLSGRTWPWALPAPARGAAPSSRAAPSARFLFGAALCPPMESSVYSPFTSRHPSATLCPPPSPILSPRPPHSPPPPAPGRLLAGLCPRRCRRPRGQGLLPGAPRPPPRGRGRQVSAPSLPR